MAKQPSPAERPAIEDVETLLAYRLPSSGKPMQSIVMPRALAERLVKEFYDLELKYKHAIRKDPG